MGSLLDKRTIRKSIEELLFHNSIANNLFGGRINEVVNDALNAYEQKHRYYHDIKHISFLFNLIDSFHHTSREREILQLVALFHDVVYDPKRPTSDRVSNNEELSSDWFVAVSSVSGKANKSNTNIIKKMILETQYGNQEGTTKLSQWFNEADLWTFIYGNVNELLRDDNLILKEYQFYNYNKYKEGRIKFLNSMKNHDKCFKNRHNISLLIKHVENYVPNIGIYAGSFNPFHIGHSNILEKAEKLFDKVIIAVGRNPEKDNLKEGNIDDNIDKIRSVIPFHEVDSFSGFLSDYIKSIEAYANVTLIRGLRNGYDFNYEINQLRFIEDKYGGNISVVFIPCGREYDYISSSAIRSIGKIGGDFYKKYL
jgi:pantetheine-phosphate adenylyltransferase